MIDSRKNSAVRLRRKGLSIKTIAQKLNAAQSSVSLWVRDIRLTEEQIAKLQSNMHSPIAIEKRRQKRLKNELAKRNAIIHNAKTAIQSISTRELWLIGIALYWAEGGKSHSMVRFSNGDPKMIQLMIKFFVEICGVDKSRLRCHIHVHESLEVGTAEKYWQEATGIPKEQFYKTYNKPNKSSKGTRNSLPYGVCDIYVLDAKLLYRLRGWAEGIFNKATSFAPQPYLLA